MGEASKAAYMIKLKLRRYDGNKCGDDRERERERAPAAPATVPVFFLTVFCCKGSQSIESGCDSGRQGTAQHNSMEHLLTTITTNLHDIRGGPKPNKIQTNQQPNYKQIPYKPGTIR